MFKLAYRAAHSCYGRLHSIREGGERSEGPDAQCKGKHKVYYNKKQYMKINQHRTNKTKRGG